MPISGAATKFKNEVVLDVLLIRDSYKARPLQWDWFTVAAPTPKASAETLKRSGP